MARKNRQCVICDEISTTGTCDACRTSAKNAKRVKQSAKSELTDEEERTRRLNVELYREVIARGGRLFEPTTARRRKPR